MSLDAFSRVAGRLRPRVGVARLICCAFAAAGLQVLGGCAPGDVTEVRDIPELQKIVASAKQPVVVDFYKAGCENCSAFEVTLGALAKDHKGRITVLKFLLKKADGNYTAPDFATEHEILSFPTVILYVNAIEWKRFVQQYKYNDYDEAINECLAGPATKPAATQAKPTSRITKDVGEH